jgi:hypothetical protein
MTVVICGLSYSELDETVTLNQATAQAGEIASCLGIPPQQLDAGFFWDGMHYTGIASSRGTDPVPDGLPPTINQQYFPEMQRSAVVVDERPEPTASAEVMGPLPSSGLLPWNHSVVWLVVLRSETTPADLAACGP